MHTNAVGQVLSLNVGARKPNPVPGRLETGIFKKPVEELVEVRPPGPRGTGPGSGLTGDYIGDGRHHGGDYQAVYAFAREELDFWEIELGYEIPDGTFGENLTTTGYEVDSAVLGEIWRIGDLRLQVTGGRTPCRTFAGVMQEQGWVKTFTQRARTGAYLMVLSPGSIRAGMDIQVESRPDHGVTVAESFRAEPTDRSLLRRMLDAGPYLHPELRQKAERAAGGSS
ncbi:MOSC domain-containing protein [Kocuria coralli]|uniref:MOSC domain-containing protein n=1 Tax=Kocuria coralli TaxID=1461025 RepID=A0A5J5KWX9_9MICC|nr:MOSC domain-containing protein [Kocuria coralli]KAA9393311.1 MOSC domain-containing protein [Kocuria coralli]